MENIAHDKGNLKARALELRGKPLPFTKRDQNDLSRIGNEIGELTPAHFMAWNRIVAKYQAVLA